MTTTTIHIGDVRDVLATLPPAYFDAVFCDPPYGLSQAGGLQSVSDRIFDTLRKVGFPKLYQFDSEFTEGREFPAVGSGRAKLSRKNRSIRVKTRVRVPETPVDFKDNPVVEHEVCASDKPAAAGVSDSELPNESDAAAGQFLGDYILKLGDMNPRRVGSDERSGRLAEAFFGGFAVPVVSPSLSGFRCSPGGLSPVNGCNHLVASGHDSLGESGTEPGVVTSTGAINALMLRFDVSGTPVELLPTHRAIQGNGCREFVGAELVRARSTASGLSAVAKPCRVRFVLSATDGTLSDHWFTLWVPLDDSISGIIPSGGFMGKGWDAALPDPEVWVQILRACKPGAPLLAFGGTRTFHRLACAIEDAGWEIRDCLMWLYGCLSEDTEVLTPDGWEPYHTAKTKEILAYDHQADVYAWEKPERWSTYRVEQDTAYRIESDTTDQIVSRNHRCLVERGGKLAFVAAEECAGVERVPTLPSDLLEVPEARAAVLLSSMQRPLSRQGVCEARTQGIGGGHAGGQGISNPKDDRPEQSSVEGRVDLLQTEGQVRQPVDQVRSVPGSIHGDGPKGRLRYGASPDCGDGVRATAVAGRVRSPRQPRRDGQPDREPDAVRVERGPQAVRARPSYRTTLATVTPIEYTGLIFCPTVSTGAFVARRNGKVFITGNSGFPKSMDISKAIDKAAGADRAEGKREWSGGARSGGVMGRGDGTTVRTIYDTPATDAARQWQGYGTALKPAWESVILAMAPLDRNFAHNALAHGVAGLNVDGCRIGSDGNEESPAKKRRETARRTGNAPVKPGEYGDGHAYVCRTSPERYCEPRPGEELGRWPANVILDDEAAAMLDAQSGELVSGKPSGKRNVAGFATAVEHGTALTGFGDTGGASRFFYTAKADKRDRGRGNIHPTVKPTDLCGYLARLILPPPRTDGQPRRLLVPFCGSGSEILGAIREGWEEVVGIELLPEHAEIAAKRIRDDAPMFNTVESIHHTNEATP